MKEKKYEVKDYGTHSVKSVDYPKIALQLAKDLVKKKMRFGILLCYTGQGMAMIANKVKGIRAAICTKPEIAKLTRAHNNANILSLGAQFLSVEEAREAVKLWLSTLYAQEKRYQARIEEAEAIEIPKPTTNEQQ